MTDPARELLERFLTGDADATEVRELLESGAVPPDRVEEAEAALRIADGLADLWRRAGPAADHVDALRARLTKLPAPIGPPAEVAPAPPSDPRRRLLSEALADVAAEEATLWLLDAAGERLVGAVNVTASGGERAGVAGAEVPVGTSVVGRVVTTGHALRAGPGDYQDPIVAWTAGSAIGALAAAPVRIGGQVRGVVSAVRAGERPFTAADEERLAWRARLLEGVLAAAPQPHEDA